MKKTDVLIRRTVLLSTVVLLISVAVFLPVYYLVGLGQAGATVQRQLLPQARALALSASTDEKACQAQTQLIALSGVHIWLDGAPLTESPAMPERLRKAGDGATGGLESVGRVRVGGVLCRYAAIPVEKSDGTHALIAAMPMKAFGNTSAAVWVGVISALIAAGFSLLPVARRMLEPVQKPLRELTKTAESISQGHLEAKCDELLPGAPGELARAVNAISSQLAMNMYDLIVERNRLRHIIDGLNEGVVAIDDRGEIMYRNPALEKLFSLNKTALHLPDIRMRVINDEDIWKDFDRVLKTGEKASRNIRSRDRIIHAVVSPTKDDLDRVSGAVALLTDITEQERLEKTRRDYVSNVSHELRTPLTAVRALIEPLKEGMVTQEADRMRYYDIILREVMRLSRLINDQLELSRLQSGSVAIEKSRFPLEDLVYEVCDRCAVMAREKGLTLNVPENLSECPHVCSNADRVEQLLVILLDNAIKYTERGSVSLLCDWDDEIVTLSVRDTGIGIDEADLPYVFDRYYKVDKAHSGKGSGLGLSIASEVIARLGEKITVSSEKGRGTCFSFTIHQRAIESEQ